MKLDGKSPGDFLHYSFNLNDEDDKYKWKVELIHCSCNRLKNSLRG